MRIYFLIDQYDGPFAGTEKQLYILISELVRRGHEVRLLAFRDTEYVQRTARFPCPIDVCNIVSVAGIRSWPKLLQLRRRMISDRPSVVHAFFNDAAIVAPLLCRTSRTAVVTSRRDLGFWYSPAILAALKFANLRTDLVICNSQAVANSAMKAEGLRASKIAVIPNAIPDCDTRSCLVPPEVRAPEPTRSTDDQTIQICLIANLRPVKRIEDLVRAAALVLHSVPAAKFIVVGHAPDPDYGATLQALARELGVEHAVHFLGRIENPASVLVNSDIGVLTSESEGLSNAIMEYMKHGLPIVCTAVGGNSELVTNGQNGVLYAPGDIESLASGIVDLCCDPAKRRLMGAVSRGRLCSYSVDALTDCHLRAYEGLITQHSRPI
jgi:glycosyltransferase involved in cell wall biosynthesis